MGYTFLRMSVTNSKEGEKYFLRSCLSLLFLFTRSFLSTGNSNVRTTLTSLVSNLVQGLQHKLYFIVEWLKNIIWGLQPFKKGSYNATWPGKEYLRYSKYYWFSRKVLAFDSKLFIKYWLFLGQNPSVSTTNQLWWLGESSYYQSRASNQIRRTSSIGCCSI